MPRCLAHLGRLIVLSLFVLSGCGGTRKSEPAAPESAPPSGADYAPAESPTADDYEAGERHEPATIEEAEAALRQAQTDLSSALGEQVAFAQPPPPPAAQPAPAEAAGAARDRSAEAEKKSEGPNCGLACRAFTSLSRAAQAVCRLDGDGGERCGRARQAVTDAEARVASCSCARP